MHLRNKLYSQKLTTTSDMSAISAVLLRIFTPKSAAKIQKIFLSRNFLKKNRSILQIYR